MLEKERLELLEKESKRIAKRNKIIAIVSCAVVAFAIVLFKVIIPTIKYNSAIALIDEGDYVGAYEASSAMDGFKDSEEKMKGVKAGDYITYGAYEQDNDTGNGQEEIEWLVLEVKDNKALVISKYALDCVTYNTQYGDTTWEKCFLRSWLNSNFIAEAFTVDERNYICETTVTADKNPDYSTNPGNDTQDEIFLLSINEVKKYFPSDNGRQCVPTEYAKNYGAYTNNDGCCWWWLRSPGGRQDSAAGVDFSGDVLESGYLVLHDIPAVRPALWINLESIDEGDYVGAYEASSAMDGFKDSEEKMKGVKAGDYITYGAYEQDNDTGNGQEEIEWLVLEVKDNKALVISKYALDCKPYNTQYEGTTWEKCSLRSWLNSNFIAEAFTVDERNYICETTVNTNFILGTAFTVDGENYISETTVAQNDTQDEIFLLSINEVKKYFPSYNGRQCMVTEYAKNKGAYTNNVGCCRWWLRSPGGEMSAAGVDDSGDVKEDKAYAADNAVRPALWINLES